MNSSFKTFIATHKLTYGAYGSVAETDYNRRDVTTNLTTGFATVANAGGFNFADATTQRVDGSMRRMTTSRLTSCFQRQETPFGKKSGAAS